MISGNVSDVKLDTMHVIGAKYVHRTENARKPHTLRYWTSDGKQRERSYATDTEAIDARNKMLADARMLASDMTFDAAFELWIAQHSVKDGTKRSYRTMYSAHLSKALGGRKLADVAADPSGVRAVVQGSTGRSLLVIVRGVVAWAQTDGIITVNRIGGHGQIKHGTIKRVREHVPYSPAQLDGMIAYLGQDGIVASIMHGTGCRVSEALALRADSFRQTADGSYEVVVTCQRDKITGADAELKRSGKVKSPPVSPELYRDVRAHALRYGTGSGRLSSSSYERFGRRMRMAAASVGIRMTAHNFRHDYALRLRAAGLEAPDIALFMGDEVETVNNTYLNHPSQDARTRALAAL